MKKLLKKLLIGLIALLLLASISFLIYANDYYKADDQAKKILQENNNIETKDDYLLLKPQNDDKNTLIIFYPGAKVEYTSYLPLLNELRNMGYTVASIKMPFNMAIFSKDNADKVLKDYPNFKKNYIMGHSMGGAMASSYANEHSENIDGLILLGAYDYANYNYDKTLTIYGSLNTSVRDKITYDKNIVVIEGANHANFGNYGKQRGDEDAKISSESQKEQTVDAIDKFLTAKQ